MPQRWTSGWIGYIAISLFVGLALAAVSSLIAISMFEPKYEAKLFFRIVQDRDWLASLGGAREEQDFETVASTIRSEIIASRVAVDSQVVGLGEISSSQNPVNQLRSMVDIRQDGDKDRFAICVIGKKPADAAIIAQTYWDHYNRMEHQYKQTKSKALYEVLGEESVYYRDRLNRLEKQLQQMCEEVTGTESVVSLEKEVDFASSLLREYKLKSETNLHAIEKVEQNIVRQRNDEGAADSKSQPDDLDHQLAQLKHDQQLFQKKIDEQKEVLRRYHRLKFEYDRKKEESETERKQFLALQERERELRLRQIAPSNVMREGISSADEAVPVPRTPIESYLRERLLVLTGISFAAAFLLVGLIRLGSPGARRADDVERQSPEQGP